eukprot:8873317-Pyramimonas_sp.AAC.1
MGMRRTENRDLVVCWHSSVKYTTSLGPVAREMENDNGAASRNLCAHNLLSVVTTFHEGGPTY